MPSTDRTRVARVSGRQVPTPVIRERTNGFTVTWEQRGSVNVSSHVTCFELEAGSGHPERFGFYEARRLTKTIVDQVMGDRPSVTEMTRQLAPSVRAQCTRLRRAADPTVAAVHHAISRVTPASPTIALDPELYRHAYVVRDIVKFRAAAIVAANLEWLQPRYVHTLIAASSEWNTLQALAQAHGAEMTFDVYPDPDSAHSVREARSLPGPSFRHLREWRNLLASRGRSYRSLDRTLMNLPRGVPGRFVCFLSTTTLPRPITDRLELFLLTLFLAARSPDIDLLGSRIRETDDGKEQLFLAARAPQIREALRRVAAHTGNDLRDSRQGDLCFLMRFLLDFPNPHRGTIVGLAKKAIRWHQHQLADERATMLQRYGAKKRVTLPPIPAPADAEVRLLETVGEVVREGEQMNHCVAHYIPDALTGRHYLFHIEHEGEAATVMVKQDGQAVQAQGPRNRRNDAAQWGERRLKAWGGGLRSVRTQRERHRDR